MRASLIIFGAVAVLAAGGAAQAQYSPSAGSGMYVAPPSTYNWRADRYNGDTRRENPTSNSYQYNREQGYVRGRSNTDAIDNTADKRYTSPTTTRNGFIDATPDKRYSPPTTGPDPNGFIDSSADRRYSLPKPPETPPQQPVTTNARRTTTEKAAAEKSAEEEKIPTTGPPRTATRKVKDNKKRDDNKSQ